MTDKSDKGHQHKTNVNEGTRTSNSDSSTVKKSAQPETTSSGGKKPQPKR